MNICVHGATHSALYSYLIHYVLGKHSESTVTLTRIKKLPKLNAYSITFASELSGNIKFIEHYCTAKVNKYIYIMNK